MRSSGKYSLLLLLVSASMLVQGQLNYKPGHIVTNAKDTIVGQINDGGGIRNAKYCLFRETEDSKATRYYPGDIEAFSISGEKYFVSRQISNDNVSKICFLEVLLEGKINLYYYYKSNFPLYYIEREGGELTGLQNKDFYNSNLQYEYPINWKAYKLGTKVYKDTLYSFFKDCAPVLNQLDIVEYNHKSLLNTSKKYVDLTCTGNDCITYEKDLNISRPGFGVFSGIQFSKISFYRYRIESGIVSSFPVGVFYNIPIDLISERLSFQLELTATRINYNNGFTNQTSDFEDLKIRSSIISVPLLLKYTLPKEKFSPSIGFGKDNGFIIDSKAKYKTTRYNSEGILSFGDVDYSLQKFQKGGWFLDLGMDYKISPKISFFTSLRFQRHYNLIISDEYYNNYTFKVAEENTDAVKLITYASEIHLGIKF